MQIILTTEESELYFYNALCNGLGYISNYGLDLEYDIMHYALANKKLRESKPNKVICYEDCLMQILRDGNKIWFVDTESDNEEHIVTLELIYERVNKTEKQHLFNMILEQDDAETADVIIQSVLFDGEIVYG
jgi:hypothetical protein